MNKKRGFTLIELLVVIAIIALLLSILMPSLKMAKEKAKFMLCKTNLKSYHVAMTLYLSDNDGKYPYSHYALFDGRAKPGLPSVQGVHQWHDKRISPENNPGYAGPLYTYLNTMKTSMCPTFRGFSKYSGHTNDSVEYDPQYSYSQNNYLGTKNTSTGAVLGVMRDAEVVSPDNVLLFVEETIWTIPGFASYTLNDTCFMARYQGDLNFGDTIATYHATSTSKPNDGKGNGVFVDGHVDLCDPHDTKEINGKEFRSSFLLSFPKRGAKSATRPY